MSNPFFRFKQFVVYHDKCAMKVGTDGVLLGAWASLKDVKTVLDVGTGTGLIAMMLFQRSLGRVLIDAIDVEEEAVLQASENVHRANYQQGIKCVHVSLEKYVSLVDKKYDLVVSNPPYFRSSLHSPDNARSIARHTDSLEPIDFFYQAKSILKDSGKIVVIYPIDLKNAVFEIIENMGMYVNRFTSIKPLESLPPKRMMLEISMFNTSCVYDELILEESRHEYTPAFKLLLKDFYLKF